MSRYSVELKKKIADRSAIIGVVGLGYVGLPLALEFSKNGFDVVGLDVDESKIEQLTGGLSSHGHICSSRIEQAISDGIKFKSDFNIAGIVDCFFICVPTPLTPQRTPDMSYVVSAIEALLPNLRSGVSVSLESTTYPGTTEEIILPALASAGFIVGDDVFVIYSPEREDPGSIIASCDTPKVISGCSEECLQIAKDVYGAVFRELVPVSSLAVAEFTKLYENIFRHVNIGLVNEMKVIADHMGLDVRETINAAATKPFGFTPYYPGLGVGGHCIPIDPYYLSWKAHEYGVHARFIELAGEVNGSMPSFFFNKITTCLNTQGKSVKNAKILILGLAYKRNIGDIRESPSIVLCRLIEESGGLVSYCDPLVSSEEVCIKNPSIERVECLRPDILSSFDLVVLTVDHDWFDLKLVCEHSKLIVDCKGVLEHAPEKVFR